MPVGLRQRPVAVAVLVGCYRGYPVFVLDILNDPEKKRMTYSQKVLNGPVRVVISRTHSRLDLAPLETHRLHICDRLITL